jgi:hypothetical protein
MTKESLPMLTPVRGSLDRDPSLITLHAYFKPLELADAPPQPGTYALVLRVMPAAILVCWLAPPIIVTTGIVVPELTKTETEPKLQAPRKLHILADTTRVKNPTVVVSSFATRRLALIADGGLILYFSELRKA